MKSFVIKVSGKVLDNVEVLSDLLKETHKLILQGHSCIVIHGGGQSLTNYCQAQHIEAKFDSEGRRITSKEEMHACDMILSGSINTNIVRLCTGLGIQAVGLNGTDNGLIIGTQVHNTFTGTIKEINTSILNMTSSHNILPVIAPVATTSTGLPLNINADEVAQAISLAWKTNHLIFISDIPGILKDKKIIKEITSSQIEQYIDNKIIHGGMVAKTKNAVLALHKGLCSVVIGEYIGKGMLSKLINGDIGTKIVC